MSAHSDYPMLARALGETAFSYLVEQTRAPVEELSRLGVRRDLVDLAKLEAARASVALEAVVLSTVVPAGKLKPAALRVRLVPHRLLELEHDALSVHWQLEEGLAPLPPAPEQVFALVWRSPRGVEHTRLTPREAAVVRMAATGAAVRELYQVAGKKLIGRVLNALSESGLIASYFKGRSRVRKLQNLQLVPAPAADAEPRVEARPESMLRRASV